MTVVKNVRQWPGAARQRDIRPIVCTIGIIGCVAAWAVVLAAAILIWQ
jgi:hypothetical protein